MGWGSGVGFLFLLLFFMTGFLFSRVSIRLFFLLFFFGLNIGNFNLCDVVLGD